MQPRPRCSPALIYVITLPLTNEKHRGRGCTCSPAPGAAPPRSAGCSRVYLVILERLAENCRGRTTAIICTRTNAPKYILKSHRLHFGSICDQNGRNFEPCARSTEASRLPQHISLFTLQLTHINKQTVQFYIYFPI